MPSPNIVFIMADDHGANAISSYSGHLNSTPNLDRIADEGVRMDALYCTNSICTPSRASILTGTYSHINGCPSIFSEFDYRVGTFPERLQDSGYKTALYGKWHLGESETAQPRGFDDWRVFPGQGDYFDPDLIGPGGIRHFAGYSTDIVTDLGLSWLKSLSSDEPFMLMLHHKAPHRPWVPHPRHSHLYPVGSIPEPATLMESHHSRSDAVRRTRMSIADELTANDIKEEIPRHLHGEDRRPERTRWIYQRFMRDYLQTVAAIDENVGRVLDYLDETGLTENTIVVYTSDQGFFLGEHGWFDKRLMFDESLQMPMMVRWPAEIPPESRCDAMVTNVDIAATLLDMCGLKASELLPSQQGRSFRTLLRGEIETDWPESVYYRYWEHDEPSCHAPAHYGVRTREHKFIYYYGDGLGCPGSSDRIFPGEYELYDLKADPREEENLYGREEYSELVAELATELAILQQNYADLPYQGPDTPRPPWSTGRQDSAPAPQTTPSSST